MGITFIGQEETAVLRGAAKFRDSLLSCLKLPPYTSDSGSLFTVKDLRDRYRNALCLACGDAGNLKGMTVKVYETGSYTDVLLEKALRQQGAAVAEQAVVEDRQEKS